MKKYIFAGLIAIGVMLFGCTFPWQPGTANGTQNGTSQNMSGEIDLEGLGYAQLRALGIPVECEFTETGEETMTKLALKIKGWDVVAEGTDSYAGGSTPVLFMVIQNESYIHVSPQQMEGLPAGCEWLQIPSGDEAGGFTEILGSPGGQLNCTRGTFGDDVFEIPAGSVCNMNEIMSNIIEGRTTGGGTMPSPCDAIENQQQKEVCKQVCDPIGDYAEKAKCVANYA